MGWENDKYIYSSGTLQRIAWCYASIYDGIPMLNFEVTNSFSVAEFKADFDLSLDAIGRGKWTGDIEDKEFKDFRGFGRLQRLVIADILNVPDNDLEAGGFRDVGRLRGYAYGQMARFLNGKPLWGERKGGYKSQESWYNR